MVIPCEGNRTQEVYTSQSNWVSRTDKICNNSILQPLTSFARSINLPETSIGKHEFRSPQKQSYTETVYIDNISFCVEQIDIYHLSLICQSALLFSLSSKTCCNRSLLIEVTSAMLFGCVASMFMLRFDSMLWIYSAEKCVYYYGADHWSHVTQSMGMTLTPLTFRPPCIGMM